MTGAENEPEGPGAWILRQGPRTDVLAEVTATWGGDTQLEIRYFMGDPAPPLSLVTSVRAVLFHERSVMVMQDGAETYHVVPGGRREPGESIEATLRREILEETGWTVASYVPLGFAHFRHLTACPPNYPYPYPDFVHLLFVAEAGEQLAEPQQGEYEIAAVFRPFDEARGRAFAHDQVALLDAALRVRVERLGK